MLEIAPALKPLDPSPPAHPAHVDVPAAATTTRGCGVASFETLDRMARVMTARVTQGVSRTRSWRLGPIGSYTSATLLDANWSLRSRR